jgi:hypothetical protein
MNSITTRFWFESKAIRDDGTFMCLTDMWRAAGEDESKRPAKWLGHEATREFIEYLRDSSVILPKDNALVRSERGGVGGSGATWAHWQLAMAYAKYLSPAFHAWCNEIVRRVMGGEPTGQSLGPLLALVEDAVARLVKLEANQAALWGHISQGGYIARSRFEALKAAWLQLADVEVVTGRWASRRAAIRDIHREMGEACDWGGKGKPWAELPAALEPAARAVLNRRMKDATRCKPQRQLALIKTG